jgi:hypothetical protein
MLYETLARKDLHTGLIFANVGYAARTREGCMSLWVVSPSWPLMKPALGDMAPYGREAAAPHR